MAKSSGNRGGGRSSGSKGGGRSGGSKGSSSGNRAGWPSRTGNPSGGGRDNARSRKG